MGVYLGAEKVDEVGLALVTKLGRLKESEYMESLEVKSTEESVYIVSGI